MDCSRAGSVLWDRIGTNTLYYQRAEPCAGVDTLRLSAYLAQADGIVECLGPAVEVHGLLDVLLTLILACQVIGGCPIPRFICYFSSLQRELYSFTSCPCSSQE